MKDEISWGEIDLLIKEYDSMYLNEIIDYNKFYLYSIISHSAAIGGSKLTELDVQLLLDEGLTADGKPLISHLICKDLLNAYNYAGNRAAIKGKISVDFLKTIAGYIMKSTGNLHIVSAGSFDSSEGHFRLCDVRATRETSFVDYLIIRPKVIELCDFVNGLIDDAQTNQHVYELSFNAHLTLSTIHPWIAGNGRASRLLMNYIQFYHGVLPVKVFEEDRADYFKQLRSYQQEGDNDPFVNFMKGQLVKTLQEEIFNNR